MQRVSWLPALIAGVISMITASAGIADVLDGARTARDAALTAEAPRYVAERWARADKALAAAESRLARGDIKTAAKRSADIEAAFREAGLEALRTRFLAPVQLQLIAADKARAERYAPRTLASAHQKLAVAEAALASHRSAPAEAASAIEAARLEALHATRIAELAMQIDRGDRSGEAVLLHLESVVDRAAVAAGLPAMPIVGDEAAVTTLITGMAALRNKADAAEQALASREQQVQSLEDELKEMDQRLGGAAAERRQLVMTLESQQRVRDQLAQLQAMFAPDEGIVLRQGRNVVLRLTGLSFGTGSAELQKRSLPLLKKVSSALSLFPGAPVLVEGHTDASGSDAANLRLSGERARVVANQLITAAAVPGQLISAHGYGKEKPIAGNDSAANRARNRRIDIVIQADAGDTGR